MPYVHHAEHTAPARNIMRHHITVATTSRLRRTMPVLKGRHIMQIRNRCSTKICPEVATATAEHEAGIGGLSTERVQLASMIALKNVLLLLPSCLRNHPSYLSQSGDFPPPTPPPSLGRSAFPTALNTTTSASSTEAR